MDGFTSVRSGIDLVFDAHLISRSEMTAHSHDPSGSTDSLKERISTHRRRSGHSRVKDPLAEFAYISLSGEHGASSAAKAIEAALIRVMLAEGYPLLSSADSRRQHVPSFSSEDDHGASRGLPDVACSLSRS